MYGNMSCKPGNAHSCQHLVMANKGSRQNSIFRWHGVHMFAREQHDQCSIRYFVCSWSAQMCSYWWKALWVWVWWRLCMWSCKSQWWTPYPGRRVYNSSKRIRTHACNIWHMLSDIEWIHICSNLSEWTVCGCWLSFTGCCWNGVCKW